MKDFRQRMFVVLRERTQFRPRFFCIIRQTGRCRRWVSQFPTE
jgi:hypothetical protein